MQNPAISVIMPVYNVERYVASAIQSILSQSFPDYELIIINDGSTDRSWDIARSFNDHRIRLLSNDTNLGNYPARNKGLRVAKGKYICVMDADDIALPDRLMAQFSFMENHPEFGLCATAYSPLNRFTPIYKEADYENIRIILLRQCHLHHPTWILRHNCVKKYNLYYDETFRYAADYVLQTRASTLFPITVLNEVHLYYRIHDAQISTSKGKEQGKLADENRLWQLSLLGINPTKEERELHLGFIKSRKIPQFDNGKVQRWAEVLIAANAKTQYYHHTKFQDLIYVLLEDQTKPFKIC
ncbi:MAG: glycosyltransferase [Tannerella sp.]|jgi:glycosyltransferase involved in cell wall biosynthesis|nr:glycosyltransferase [Tannerella sp.]